MIKAVDIASTRSKEKPYNSILPYLRQKEAEKAEKAEAEKKSKTDEEITAKRKYHIVDVTD